MSEESTTVEPTQSESEYKGEPLVEKAIAQEVAPKSQDDQANAQDVSKLVAESRKYRQRSQKDRQELETLQKRLESDREQSLADQNQWQQLAEERAARISELEPVVANALAEEEKMREQILSNFADDDRETFGDLPLSKLRVLNEKLNKQTQTRVPVASNPAVTGGDTPKEWWNMDKTSRSKNWAKIVAGYAKK